jgi:hypothetical protein
MPASAFADWLDSAGRTLPADAFGQLRHLVQEPPHRMTAVRTSGAACEGHA